MSTQMTPGRSGRLAVPTAVIGTVLIGAGAFWLSFTALADLARRSGISVGQAWAWPLIVDGIIVVATVAVVALAGTRSAWYPWMLLGFGAGLSVTANFIHAILTADPDVPWLLAGSVASVPPLVLLAITHLTVILTRHRAEPHPEHLPPPPLVQIEPAPPTPQPQPAPALVSHTDAAEPEEALVQPLAEDRAASGRGGVSGAEGRAIAEVLRESGWSHKKIARHLGIATSTVGRWYPRPEAPPAPEPSEPAERPARTELPVTEES